MKPTWCDEAAGVYLFRGDSERVVPELAGVAAVVTDPPYGLAPMRTGTGSSRGGAGSGFMGLPWDRDVPAAEFWELVLAACRPGAPVFSFGGCRTYHRMAGRIEAAGFQVVNQLAWLFGTGFPKGAAVDKLLDRRRHDRPAVLKVTTELKRLRLAAGLSNAEIDEEFGLNGMAGHWCSTGSQPAVPKPEQWEKLRAMLEPVPAWVDEEVARLNGLKGTPGEWYAQRGTVGTCAAGRDGWSPGDGAGWRREFDVTAAASPEAKTWEGWSAGGQNLKPAMEPICYAQKPRDGSWGENALEHGVAGLWVDGARVGGPGGRRPANVVHDGSGPVLGVLGAAGESRSRRRTGRRAGKDAGRLGAMSGQESVVQGYDDEGTAARFFYCAKPSKAERTAGGRVENGHPTVKPVELMRWLVRLSMQAGLPGGGLVLDPFAGSGTTAVAAVAEGRPVVAIESDRDSFRTMRDRVRAALSDRAEPATAERRAA